jgi:hypothetical protein
MEIFPTTNMYLVMDDDGQPVYHVNDGAGSDGVLWHAGDHWETPGGGLDGEADRIVELGEHGDARDALAELNRHIGLVPDTGPEIDQSTADDELTARYYEMIRQSQAELNRHIRL